MKFNSIVSAAFGLWFLSVAAVTVTAQEQMEVPPTIIDVVENSTEHTALANALTAGRLTFTLRGEGPFTIFAPTDAAFDALPQALLDRLFEDDFLPHLQNLLQYHVVPGLVQQSDLQDGQVGSLSGEALNVSLQPSITVNSVPITGNSVVTENGIVHIIDQVFTPQWLGRSVTDYASSSPNFSVLTALIVEAGLVEFMNLTSPITVFVPTNRAFEDTYGQETLQEVRDDLELLRKILQYHVVEGVFTEEDLENRTSITMLNGVEAAIDETLGLDFTLIANAPITDGNQLVRNGMVHVIDAVMEMPFGFNTSIAPVATPLQDGNGPSPSPAPTVADGTATNGDTNGVNSTDSDSGTSSILTAKTLAGIVMAALGFLVA